VSYLYPAHGAFVAPARFRPQLWRLGLGIALCAALYAAVSVLVFMIATLVLGGQDARDWIDGTEATPIGTLLLLSTFIGMAIGPFLAARWLHKRPMLSLFGEARGFWTAFLWSVVICAGLYGLVALIPSDVRPAPNLSIEAWVVLLPVAVLGVLIQTGAEEVLFRGYIQQQLAARFASPLIWMILPSVLFAMGHYQPDIMGDNAWIIVAAAAFFGILAADLTARTGSIGAAWGFHFANNSVAILFVAMDGPLAGLSLYTVPFAPMDTAEMRPLLYVNFVMMLITWGLIRLTLPRMMRR